MANTSMDGRSDVIVAVQMDDHSPRRLRLDVSELEELSLRDLAVTEAVLEEFVRLNIEVLFPEGESLLVVGQQSRNASGGRADLVAIDAEGNMVLLELKRDVGDITHRAEPFEFQAVRYAASYATVKTVQELVQKLYAPYIQRHAAEFDLSTLSASELAARRLDAFLANNGAFGTFNRRQRIVLIASSFDTQTLSACAWLAKNGIDIRCVAMQPLRHENQLFFEIDQVIPPRPIDTFFVELAETRGARVGAPATARRAVVPGEAARTYLPRMEKLLEWGVLSAGQKFQIKRYADSTAELLDHQHVRYQGETLRINAWGLRITGWSSMNIYDWVIDPESEQTLGQLREAYMLLQEARDGASTITSPPSMDAELG